MARRRILATAAAAVLAGAYWATAGAGTAPTRVSTPRATAAAFLVAEIEAKADGRWRAAWSTLYPLHRRVAPRETFVRCERATPLPAQLESLRVARTAPAAVKVAGLGRTVPGVAVTVTIRLRAPELAVPFSFRHTFHVVRVRGSWRWLLSASRYRLYARHGCGEAPAA